MKIEFIHNKFYKGISNDEGSIKIDNLIISKVDWYKYGPLLFLELIRGLKFTILGFMFSMIGNWELGGYKFTRGCKIVRLSYFLYP